MCNLVDFNGVMVADIKRDFLEAYLNEIKKHDGAKVLILYGSIFEVECKDDSDIECVLLGSVNMYKGYQILDKACDACFDLGRGQIVYGHYFNIDDYPVEDGLNFILSGEKGKIVWSR